MKKLGTVSIFLFVISLLLFQYLNSEKEPGYCKYADKVTQAFKSSVKKQYDLTATMQGGAFMDQINAIHLSFHAYKKKYSIDETRELMLACTEEFLDRINANEKVRPFLEHFPFTEKGLELSIYFYEKRFQKVDNNYIAGVHLVNSHLYYSIFSEEKSMYINVYEEPYAEAFQEVKDAGLLTYDRDFNKKPCNSFRPLKKGNKIDSLYSEEERVAYSILDQVGKKFFCKYGLEPSGVGGNMNKDIKTLFLGLTCNQEKSINDARKLIVTCAKEYIFEINNSKKLIPFLHNFPFNEQNIELSITFKYPIGSSNEIGKLSSVEIIKGKVCFNVNKTEYTLETVLEEDFDEAVRIAHNSR